MGLNATNVDAEGSSPSANTRRVSSSGQDNALPARKRRFESGYPLQFVEGTARPPGQAQSCKLCYVSSILTPCSNSGDVVQWEDDSFAPSRCQFDSDHLHHSCRRVAQRIRAAVSETAGRWFESTRDDQAPCEGSKADLLNPLAGFDSLTVHQ